MESKKEYCLMDLENCLIRFMLLLSDYKDIDKSDLNEFEINKDLLKNELLDILKQI